MMIQWRITAVVDKNRHCLPQKLGRILHLEVFYGYNAARFRKVF